MFNLTDDNTRLFSDADLFGPVVFLDPGSFFQDKLSPVSFSHFAYISVAGKKSDM